MHRGESDVSLVTWLSTLFLFCRLTLTVWHQLSIFFVFFFLISLVYFLFYFWFTFYFILFTFRFSFCFVFVLKLKKGVKIDIWILAGLWGWACVKDGVNRTSPVPFRKRASGQDAEQPTSIAENMIEIATWRELSPTGGTNWIECLALFPPALIGILIGLDFLIVSTRARFCEHAHYFICNFFVCPFLTVISSI